MIDPVVLKFNEAVWHDQAYQHPQLGRLTQRDFFNREQEKAQLEQLLTAHDCRTVAIVGERRSGKTSFLKCSVHRLEQDASGQFLPVLIPWQGIQTRDALADEILYGIRRQVIKACPTATPARLDHTPPTDNAFLELIKQLVALIPGRQIIICIDEYDSLVEEAPQPEQPRLLTLITRLAECRNLPVRLLLTITGETDRLPSLRGVPLLAQATRVRLRPFTPPVFFAMVRELLGPADSLSPQELEYLYVLSGGWPYFGKLLLVALTEVVQDDDRLAHALVVAITHADVADTLINIYTMHLDDAEKALMLLLAQTHNRVRAADLVRCDVMLDTAAGTLVERDFVARYDDGSYRFQIGLLAQWFQCWPRGAEEALWRLPPAYAADGRLADRADGCSAT